MKHRIFAALLAIFSISLVSFFSNDVSALGLKTAPLEYKTTLKKDERQQGFIDISNPSYQSVTIRTSVQAFKQIDNQGGLQFFDDKQISLGIKPDLDQFTLGPREAVRMSFTINSANLPKGDVYAAIFFTSDVQQPRNGVGQLVRVGTILSIVNQSPGARDAEISKLSIPFLQLTNTIKGTYRVKNTSSKGTGFYPDVTVSAWPAGKAKTMQSTLVFAGRERQNDFSYSTGMGIHLVEVGYGASKKSQWVVTLPAWAIIVLLLIIVVFGVEYLLYKKRRKSRKKAKPQKPASTS